MQLFRKLLGRKTPHLKEENFSVTINNLTIDDSLTSEKFLPMKNELVEFLITILQEINRLEQEIFNRSEKLKNPKEPNQVQPGEDELWEEYTSRYRKIVSPIFLDTTQGNPDSFGNPAKYDYLLYPDTKLIFIMKSENRAVVEIEFYQSIGKKEQFVLKKEIENWKIATKKYGFIGENTWHKDSL